MTGGEPRGRRRLRRKCHRDSQTDKKDGDDVGWLGSKLNGSVPVNGDRLYPSPSVGRGSGISGKYLPRASRSEISVSESW